jgi:hypothetical protein
LARISKVDGSAPAIPGRNAWRGRSDRARPASLGGARVAHLAPAPVGRRGASGPSVPTRLSDRRRRTPLVKRSDDARSLDAWRGRSGPLPQREAQGDVLTPSSPAQPLRHPPRVPTATDTGPNPNPNGGTSTSLEVHHVDGNAGGSFIASCRTRRTRRPSRSCLSAVRSCALRAERCHYRHGAFLPLRPHGLLLVGCDTRSSAVGRGVIMLKRCLVVSRCRWRRRTRRSLVCKRGGAHVPSSVSDADHRAGGRNQNRARLPPYARGA